LLSPRTTITRYQNATVVPAPDCYPSWTAVGVTQLALPELCIEIRAVGVVGCGGPDTGTEG